MCVAAPAIASSTNIASLGSRGNSNLTRPVAISSATYRYLCKAIATRRDVRLGNRAVIAGCSNTALYSAITGALAARRRQRAIERLSDHFIICGYGRVGRRVAQEFAANGVPFVVLDFSEDAIEEATEAGVLFIEGNGVEDEDLQAEGRISN